MIHLDTHVVAWLFAGVVERIPPATRERLETETLAISPVAALELEHLHEIDRVSQPAEIVLADLERRIGLQIADAPLSAVVERARNLGWTRDPFDRLIAAHAVIDNAPLLTADRTIRANLALAAWG